MAEHARPSPLDEGSAERIPVYPFPENASRALGKIATYAAWRNDPPGLFWSFNDIHVEEARAVCREAADSRGDTWLTEDERNKVANAIGLPVVPCLLARTVEEAIAVAEVVGYPVVVKINSPRASHKTDVGGVRLNLTSARGVRKAFNEIAAEAAAHGIADAMEGVWVQPMVEGGVETLVGLVDDPLFGPLVGLGLGGTDVEAIRDVHFRVTPLTDRDADELLHEMRGFALLDGFRGRPRADLDALTDVVLRVSRLAEDVPEIQELDLNPVIVLPAGKGCRIVDARIRVSTRLAR
jgi:acyl-CoA synthetase (NDP forming)